MIRSDDVASMRACLLDLFRELLLPIDLKCQLLLDIGHLGFAAQVLNEFVLVLVAFPQLYM